MLETAQSCAVVRPEFEQNSSHLQIDCEPGSLAIKLATIEVSAQADIDTAFQVPALRMSVVGQAEKTQRR